MFKPNDRVELNSSKGKSYGIVYAVKGDKCNVFFCEIQDYRWVRADKLSLFKPIVFDNESIKKFFRFEHEDKQKPIWACKVKKGTSYTINIQDFLVALENIKKAPAEAALWCSSVCIGISFDRLHNFVTLPSSEEIIEGFPSDYSVYDDFFRTWNPNEQPGNIDFHIQRVKRYLENKSKPAEDWTLSDEEKQAFLEAWDDDGKLELADERTLSLIRRYAEELGEKNVEIGLKTMAYGYYCGAPLFQVDFEKSTEYLEKLIPFDTDGFYSNTLGYIYYYGRVGGEPDYDKAFRYFSIGHQHGVYESSYKIADMYMNGYSVSKNEKCAHNILNGLYRENLRYVIGDESSSKFADIALRIGKMQQITGKNEPFTLREAYRYYLQADYAIRLRRKEIDYVGDDKVFDAIQKKLAEIRESEEYPVYLKNGYLGSSLEDILRDYLDSDEVLIAKIVVEGQNAKLIIKNSEEKNRLFVTIPEKDFCGKVDSIVVKLEDYTGHSIIYGNNDEFLFNGMNDCGVFFLQCKKVAYISSGWLSISKSQFKSKKEYNVYTIKFVEDGSFCYCISDSDYSVGDKAVVKPKGEGVVIKIRKLKDTELEFPAKLYARI